MPSLALCSRDPIITTLRDVFGANIVRVPEARIRPLTVLASSGGRTSFRGELLPLMSEDVPLDVPIRRSLMSNVAGRRSSVVKIELALKILEGFLRGLRIPSSGVAAHLGRVEEVSFAFQEVRRHYVDSNNLGAALVGRRIDARNPAASVFREGWAFLLIDSVIGSRAFTIHVEKAAADSFQLDVPAIQSAVAQAATGVRVGSLTGLDLVFEGRQELGFAFTCVRILLAVDGSVQSLPPHHRHADLGVDVLSFDSSGHTSTDRVFEPVFLTPEPAMIELD